jgi:hypothetical protein
LFSSIAWQQLLPQVAVAQSVGQLHSSPKLHVPSPQPLQGGPQVWPIGHWQSAQVEQSSPASHWPLPHTGRQSIGQEPALSPP